MEERMCETCKYRKGRNWCSHNKTRVKKDASCINWASDEALETETLEKVSLNQAADLVLKHLDPTTYKELCVAAAECKLDIGIYLLGLVNKSYLAQDYYNPHIDDNWLKDNPYLKEDLYCQYKKCGKLMENATHINQKFCDNKCAKLFHLEENKSEIIHPVEKPTESEEKQDLRAWEAEEKRANAYIG